MAQQAAATSPTAASVFMALHIHANTGGRCFPSQQQIAAITGLSVRAVRYATRKLQALGLVSVTPGSGRSVSQYQIRYPAIDRGCSPLERRPAPAVPRQPARAPDRPRAAPAADGAPDVLEMYRSPEKLRAAAQRYATTELTLVWALEHCRAQQPHNLAAYLSRTLQRHQSGQQLLPGVDLETRHGLESDLRHLRNGRALA